MIQFISVLGSLAILAAYAANQFRWLNSASLPYMLLNLVGSAILSIIAIVEQQWGFLLLEGVWALLTLWSIIQYVKGNRVEAAH